MYNLIVTNAAFVCSFHGDSAFNTSDICEQQAFRLPKFAPNKVSMSLSVELDHKLTIEWRVRSDPPCTYVNKTIQQQQQQQPQQDSTHIIRTRELELTFWFDVMAICRRKLFVRRWYRICARWPSAEKNVFI